MPNRSVAPENTVIRHMTLEEPRILPLRSGFDCYLCPTYNVGVVRFELYWSCGSLHQLMHYQAKAALQLGIAGTAKHSAEEILNRFEGLGADVQVNVSAMSCSLILSVASYHFGEALDWLFYALDEAVFPATEIENFKQVESAELLRKMQSPSYWSKRTLSESLYALESPMARFASPEHLQLLQRENVQGFYTQFFGLDKAHVILSGEVSPALCNTVISGMDKHFQGVATPTFLPISAINDYAGKKMEHALPHANQVSVMMGRLMPAQDSETLHRLVLLNGLLGGFFGSRLMQEIREEKGLTYGIGSYIEPTPEGNRWIISGEMNSDNAELALKEMNLILESMYKHAPEGDELEKAKRYISGQIRGSFDGPFAWPGKIRQMLLRGLGFDHYRNALDIIWGSSSAELCALADTFLRPASFCTAMAGQLKK